MELLPLGAGRTLNSTSKKSINCSKSKVCFLTQTKQVAHRTVSETPSHFSQATKYLFLLTLRLKKYLNYDCCSQDNKTFLCNPTDTVLSKPLSYRKYFTVFNSILTEELLPMAYLLVSGLPVKSFQIPHFPAVLLSLKSQYFVFNLSIYILLDAIGIKLIQKKELREGS